MAENIQQLIIKLQYQKRTVGMRGLNIYIKTGKLFLSFPLTYIGEEPGYALIKPILALVWYY